MLWLKSLHIVFLVSWFAGLFYLPRLFVYHAMATDAIGIERFKVMERKLYYGIMAPSAVLTIVSGMCLWLGKLMRDFREDRNRHRDVFYRWINEIPALPVLVAIVLLVVFKPF